jgi:DUF4097 and DUF4098 domain-containing protein YvlB
MPRRDVTGPILLIAVGSVFLLQMIRPGVPLFAWFTNYWPYLLIGWGILQLLEVLLRFGQRRPVPVNGVSGVSWLLVLVICLVGFAGYQSRRPDNWWHKGDFLINGFEAFGREREFSVVSQQQRVTGKPHLVIENFRGDAKITVGDDGMVALSGRKLIRAGSDADVAKINESSPVELISRGESVVVRCHQDVSNNNARVTTNLELVVPRNTSLEATGRVGDFEVTGLSGDIDIASENAGVRLQDIVGSVKVDTRRSDIVRCIGVKGPVRLLGHGDDLEMRQVTGPVDVSGSYTGRITLRDIPGTVHVSSFRNEFTLQSLPGEVRLERGELSMQDVAGPVRLKARATDIKLEGFTNQLDLQVDKGDVDLRPLRTPLPEMIVRTSSGNINLEMPQAAGCDLQARTSHGEISNDFNDVLRPVNVGRGAQLRGSIGGDSGPAVRLETARGSINLRRLDRSSLVSKTDQQDDDK